VRPRTSLGLYLGVSSAVVILDQVSKRIALSALGDSSSLTAIPGLVLLTRTSNTGAAFGLMPGFRILFMLIALAVVVTVIAYVVRERPESALLVVALGLVTGGAAGNFIDRALTGQVVDFLEFAFIDFPVFNVADIGIVVGVGLLVLWLAITPPPKPAEEAPPPDGAV
jgi:signal peptidase II